MGNNALLMAEALAAQGIDFVPVPVTSPEHKISLIAQALAALGDIDNDTDN